LTRVAEVHVSIPTTTITRIAQFVRPTALGTFDVNCYVIDEHDNTGYAVMRGNLPVDDLLVRIQSPCLFGETFGINSCDCAAQLHKSVEIGAGSENFLLIYLTNQEGRGHGLVQKIKAVAVEANEKVDMVEAFRRLDLPLEKREWNTAAAVLRDVNGDRPIRLMTNNPKKVKGMEEAGIVVSERVPVLTEPPNAACLTYLQSKKRGMGHLLPNIPDGN
jgi:GTP cyclohydrolase II